MKKNITVRQGGHTYLLHLGRQADVAAAVAFLRETSGAEQVGFYPGGTLLLRAPRPLTREEARLTRAIAV